MKTFTKIFLIALLVLPFNGFSQTDNHHEHKTLSGGDVDKFYLPFEYDADSLVGFDEAAAWEHAKKYFEEEWEQKRVVAALKRNYIDFNNGSNKPVPSIPSVQAPCTNAGFEDGTLNGWTTSQSDNNDSQTMLPWGNLPTTQIIIQSLGPDPNIAAIPRVPPGGGNFSVRLGLTGALNGGKSYRLSQTFTVTPANSVFIYRYAVILNNSSPHECDQQPFFNIRFEDCNNNPIPCGAYAVTSIGSECSSGDPSFQTSGSFAYKNWTTRSFDLTAYIGQCVNVEFTVGGCIISQAGHGGYAYVDAQCQPMTLNLNGTDIPVGQTTTNFCAIGTNTLTAPPGFTSYTWSGPGVTGLTTQSITTSAPGTYSVTLGMAGNSCNSPVLFSNFNLVPKPIADFNFVTTPCQSSFVVPFTDASSVNGGPAITGHFWDFNGDGVADNLTANPSHDFLTAGTYTVELKVDNGGCNDKISKVVSVSPAVTANFINNTTCLGGAINFTSTSTPTVGLVAHNWNFGDNTTGMGPNPSHVYTTSGVFNVTYTVTNSSGCPNVIMKTVTISPSPIISITANTVCLNSSTIFGNTSTVAAPGNISNWSWNFGDGSALSASQNANYTYATAGSYNAVLTATTSNGCISSGSVAVKVNALPTAAFAPVNACVNANVVLNNTSSIPSPDNIQSYAWNFGLGGNIGTSNIANPILNYTTSGIKNITLNLMSNNTCTATVSHTVQIYPKPVANFSTTSVCQNTATAFTDLSTTSVGTINQWAWSYTSNGINNSTISAPTNLYPTSGTFTAQLIVTSSNNCFDTVKLPVQVWGHTVPDFSPDKVCFGTSSAFTNLTNETTNANTGSGATYVWDFGDGSAVSSVNAPSHTYILNGNVNAIYNVTLTATSFHGCIDNIIKPVNVYGIPTASFTADSVCLGTATQLVDASNGNGNIVNTFIWDFLSDGIVDATGVPNPNFTFPAYGNNIVSYTVSVSPANGLVCSNSTSTIQVWVNPIPVPDFTFTNKCINSQPNTFDGSSSAIAVGSNASYVWYYGDGQVTTPSISSSTTHTYNQAGVYNVTLTATSNKGCQNYKVKQVEVYEKPYVQPLNSPTCSGSAMSFTAVSAANSGIVSKWFWDFNNSITTIEATTQTASYSFPASGSQTVNLVTETNQGCRDTIQKVFYVNYVPAPQFSVNIQSGCSEHCVSFTDITPALTGPARNVSFEWFFGDGSNQVNTDNSGINNHCYKNLSTSQIALFDVKLVIVTDAGCRDSLIKVGYITVFPTPIAKYTVNPNPGNVVTPLINFINESQDYIKWWWSFGDGPDKSDSVNLNPTHFYNDATAATYYSNLIVKNQYGCSDTAFMKIEIGPEFTFYVPNAFSPSNEDGVNDFFFGSGIGIAAYEMWIFDRWGERVFYTDDITIGWNGKVQGKSKEGKQDVYVWKVKLKDVLGKKHDYIGHVTLLK